MQKNQLKSGDLVAFDLDSYIKQGETRIFSSYLTSMAFTNEPTLFEIQHGEIGIVISSIFSKTAVLFTNSRKILKVDTKKLTYIGEISP